MIVAVITLSGFVVSFQFNPVISVFMAPITAEFGWTRSMFASAVTVGTLAGGGVALFIGPLTDRFGPRWVLALGFAAFGALLLGMGRTGAFWQFWLMMVTSRLLVQGVLNITNSTVIARWFYRLRGRASSVALIGQNLGNATMPALAQSLVLSLGWRAAIGILGLLAWGITLLPVLAWLRRRPEDMGLRPDGDTSLVNSPGAAAQSGGFTLREALRTRAFLLLLFAFVMNQITGSSLTFSMLPILQERGLTAGQAVAVLSVWGFATVPGVLLAGYLRDRWPLRKVMVWTFGGTTVGFAVLFVTNNPWTGMLFAVVYGVPFAASIMMQTLAFADVFGPQSLGAIRGFTQPFLMGFNALAPLGASLLFDITGGYGPVLASYMVFSAAATLAVWGLRLPVAAQARAG